MSRDGLYQQLRGHRAYLNLSAAAEARAEALDRAVKAKIGSTEFIDALCASRSSPSKPAASSAGCWLANFPAPWRLDDFDFTAQPGITKPSSGTSPPAATWITPPTCSTARSRQDPPRRRPGPRRRRSRPSAPTTAPPPTSLPASRHRGPLEHHAVPQRTHRVDHRRDRLSAHARRGRQRPLQVISPGYLIGSIILTTNRGLTGWGQIFEDTTIAATLLDRLLHRCVPIDSDSDSYQLRARKGARH